jgi:hypothetical protein
MDDPRIVYLEKLKLLRKAESAMNGIIDDIRTLGAEIGKYDRVLLPDEDTPFSPSTFAGDGKVLKVLDSEWPTFEKFSSALRTWRQARLNAETAYDNVPDKTGLEDLPNRPTQSSTSRGFRLRR